MCYAPWYQQFFDLNPAFAERRSLLHAYAASKSKKSQAYLRGLFPAYWRTCDCPGGGAEPGSASSDRGSNERSLNARLVGPSLGLSATQEVDILDDLFAFVLPRLRSSPRSQAGRDPRSLRFPQDK